MLPSPGKRLGHKPNLQDFLVRPEDTSTNGETGKVSALYFLSEDGRGFSFQNVFYLYFNLDDRQSKNNTF